MNFLAHIYLSGENDLLKIGNFAADSIVGNHYKQFPQTMQDGIMLHRKIDTFTDSHPIVYKSKHRLFEKYGHYNSVIVDVLYDHFLAKNWLDYHPQALENYVADFYTLLRTNFEILPDKTQNFYPYMVQQNWLLNYAEIEGIKTVLHQMSRRTVNYIQLDGAVAELQLFYTEFEEEFTAFFKELQAYVEELRS